MFASQRKSRFAVIESLANGFHAVVAGHAIFAKLNGVSSGKYRVHLTMAGGALRLLKINKTVHMAIGASKEHAIGAFLV